MNALIRQGRLPLNQIDGKLDASFVRPCIKHFGFLESERGFKGSFFGVGGESTVSFEKDNVRIDILFNIPETPSVSVYTPKENRIVSSSEEVKKKIKEMNSIRDKGGLEIWHKTLKNGGFDDAMDVILNGLAEEIRKSF